ncbi:MAG: right-handed parallel beta-helix repeat-containing protein [Planctomycetota bacterium]|jgi:hypothetical protein
MKKQLTFLATLFMALVIAELSVPTVADSAIVVNSLEDVEVPPEGTVTIRSALASAADGESIVFDESLDGGTIELSIIGDEHTVLKGEVMGMEDTPSGPVSYLVGYFERDYGKSALYAQKNVVIDASALPSGITLAWGGGSGNPARVLAVYGDLTMTNVSITGGWSVAEALVSSQDNCNDEVESEPMFQCSTRARGGALAVWGVATLRNCTLYNNHCFRASDVPARGRDAGVFGGGIYADIVDMKNCVVSGNSVSASGVSGGGVFSVGGADTIGDSEIIQTAITGNHITGLLAYGGGVYSDGGGIGNANLLTLRNCTIARNLVDASAALPLPFVYWRGGGVYMSNGYLTVQSCTIVENQVYGVPRTDALGKPNMAGGIVATIGNAHAVERMKIGHSVIAGNTVHPVAPYSGIPISGAAYEQDIFTGTLLHFESLGYNRIGTIDFSQMLVPVGQWKWFSLIRKHYPKEGDQDGVNLTEVLDLSSGITYSDTILSEGVDAPNPVVLHYQPKGNALDQVPASDYEIIGIYGQYDIPYGVTNNFLEIILQRIEDEYITSPGDFPADFTADFESFLASVDLDPDTEGNQPYTKPDGVTPILTLLDAQWFGPARTWPKELPNYPYIEFWHRLDAALEADSIPRMGPELLGEDAWTTLFSQGNLVENPNIWLDLDSYVIEVEVEVEDQNGIPRPANTLSDIGAYEYFSPPCFGDVGEDGDVDGSDLAEFAAGFDLGDYDEDDLASFAAHFGRTDCS